MIDALRENDLKPSNVPCSNMINPRDGGSIYKAEVMFVDRIGDVTRATPSCDRRDS